MGIQTEICTRRNTDINANNDDLFLKDNHQEANKLREHSSNSNNKHITTHTDNIQQSNEYTLMVKRTERVHRSK